MGGALPHLARESAAEQAFQTSAITEDNLGHQMLAGMGWKGGGLGSSGGGIAEPIRARGEGGTANRASFHQ